MIASDMNWFDMWLQDRRDIANIMRKNMAADLDAGYDPKGHSIRKQIVDIEEYEMNTDRQLDMFKTMEDKAVNRWCYYDMKKRGVIA